MNQKVTKKTSLNNYAVNRLRRIAKQLKLHPEDKQAQEAQDLNKTVSTRKSPNAKMGWMSSNKEVDTFVRGKLPSSLTKQAAMSVARIFKFVKNAPFHLQHVFVSSGGEITTASKHTSKFSNFKGEAKAIVVKKD